MDDNEKVDETEDFKMIMGQHMLKHAIIGLSIVYLLKFLLG